MQKNCENSVTIGTEPAFQNRCQTHCFSYGRLYTNFSTPADLKKSSPLPILATSVAQCTQMDLDREPLTLRLIRIQNDGKVQVLITSLIDSERFPIEEDYKAIKCRMELENFSGKSPLSVYQDFHAKVFVKNLVSVLASPLKDFFENKHCTKKHEYQINFTQALSKSKGVVALLFHHTGKQIRKLIAALHDIFQRTVEPVRLGKKYPRNHKAKPRIFFLQYKPIG